MLTEPAQSFMTLTLLCRQSEKWINTCLTKAIIMNFMKMGAHVKYFDYFEDKLSGVSFAVWAPNARRVSVVGDFNNWDGRRHVMRTLGNSGIWEIFVPGLQVGQNYKFEIKTKEGALLEKDRSVCFLCGSQT